MSVKHHALGLTLLTGFAATPMALAQEAAAPTAAGWQGYIEVTEAQDGPSQTIRCQVRIVYRPGQPPSFEKLQYYIRRMKRGQFVEEKNTATILDRPAVLQVNASPPKQDGRYDYYVNFEPGPRFATTPPGGPAGGCPFSHVDLKPSGTTADPDELVGSAPPTSQPYGDGTETRKLTWELHWIGPRTDQFSSGQAGGQSTTPSHTASVHEDVDPTATGAGETGTGGAETPTTDTQSGQASGGVWRDAPDFLVGAGWIPWTGDDASQLGYTFQLRSDAHVGDEITGDVVLSDRDKKRFEEGKAVIVGIKGLRTGEAEFATTGVWVKLKGKDSPKPTYYDVTNANVILGPAPR